MNEQKSLLIYLGEALDRYRAARRRTTQEQASPKRSGWLRALLPTPGNALFTLLVVAGLLWATSAGALPLRAPAAGTSTGTIAYQGRLADADGNPLTGTYNMIFRLYDVATGGTPLWTEQWTGSNGVRVSDGLFNVMLGSLTSIPEGVITGHDSLFLGITVGTDDEMTPRVQLGSVPFAVQALTVPDGSITTAKIADRAVTLNKLTLEKYRFWRLGDQVIHYRGPTGQETTLDISSCSASGLCCDPSNTIYYQAQSGQDSILAFRLEGAKSLACTLLHEEDDYPPGKSKGIYFTTEGGNQGPFGTWTASFSRDGVQGIPMEGYTQYWWICF